MKRPSITIILLSGERYDANHVAMYQDQREGGSGYSIAFQCSGHLTVTPAETVASIAYAPAGAEYCGTCDQPLTSLIGTGIFAGAMVPHYVLNRASKEIHERGKTTERCNVDDIAPDHVRHTANHSEVSDLLAAGWTRCGWCAPDA